MSALDKKTIVVTGGTGSWGNEFVKIALRDHDPIAIRIFANGEPLMTQMMKRVTDYRVKFLQGDIRDPDRLARAFYGADIVIHAAALKHIDLAEYNPDEVIKTNILGSLNVLNAAINNRVEKVFAISTDKACHPSTLYGATKLVMEKLMIQGNVYGRNRTKISCCRYGNVVGSSGSVVPIFKDQAKQDCLNVTDKRMTRFWIPLNRGVEFVINCLEAMRGGEIFIPKIPSAGIEEIAKAVAPNVINRKCTGIRPGEKLHEVLINENEARLTREYEDYFVIQPEHHFWTEEDAEDQTGRSLPDGFEYSSRTNPQRLSAKEIVKLL